MQGIVDYSAEDEFFRRGSIYPNLKEPSLLLSLGRHVDVHFPPFKRSRVSAPIFYSEGMFETQQTTIEAIPEECLVEIFKRLPGRDEKSSCACVSKHWLVLLSSIRRDEFLFNGSAQASEHEQIKVSAKVNDSSETKKDELAASDVDLDVDEDFKDDGYLSRSLEGKKATDIRLAAIAVGTGNRGGLGKLSVRGSNTVRPVTNFGMKAIARGCPSLKVLSLWSLTSIGDDGLLEIAKECHMIEKFDLSHCPKITDTSFVSIVSNCPNLSSVAIESCPNIGDESLQALGRMCPNLKSLSIKNCPRVGDQGIASLMSSASLSLTKLKLEALNITDLSLAVIGHYGKAVTDLALLGLQNVSEKGFWVMGNGHGLQKLRSFVVMSCLGVTDLGLEAVGKGCPNLKQLRLLRCAFLSDSGLVSFAKAAVSLECLVVEECHRITQSGIFGVLINCGKLRALSLANCFGIKDVFVRFPFSPCKSLRSLSIRNCPGFGNVSLAMLGRLCPQLQNVDVNGLHGITDEGLLPLIQSTEAGLTKVNIGCMNLTDRVVSAICKLHGGTLQVLNLNGCGHISDASLAAIAENCLLLNELDISNCKITDAGIAALASAMLLNLQILSLSGCSLVSNKSLPCLLELGETLLGLNIQNCHGISSSSVNLLVERLWKCDILS